MTINTIFDVVRPTMPTSTGRGFFTNKWGEIHINGVIANTKWWTKGGRSPHSLLPLFSFSFLSSPCVRRPPSRLLFLFLLSNFSLFVGPFGLLLMGLSGLSVLGSTYYFLALQVSCLDCSKKLMSNTWTLPTSVSVDPYNSHISY